VFNGDLVDRGPHSVEITILLLACLLINRSQIFINRGNHEDHVMNLRQSSFCYRLAVKHS